MRYFVFGGLIAVNLFAIMTLPLYIGALLSGTQTAALLLGSK